MALFPKGKVFQVDSIARKRKISPIFLHKIFQKLTRAGILVSRRGVQGGFALAKSPVKISVMNVTEVLQGPVVISRCLNKKHTCKRTKNCSLKKKLNIIQEKYINVLDRLTLKELAREEIAL